VKAEEKKPISISPQADKDHDKMFCLTNDPMCEGYMRCEIINEGQRAVVRDNNAKQKIPKIERNDPWYNPTFDCHWTASGWNQHAKYWQRKPHMSK